MSLVLGAIADDFTGATVDYGVGCICYAINNFQAALNVIIEKSLSEHITKIEAEFSDQRIKAEQGKYTRAFVAHRRTTG